jgi:hypothetical protein
MVRRILSVVKNGKPYELNKNLVLDTKIKLPEEADVIQEEI